MLMQENVSVLRQGSRMCVLVYVCFSKFSPSLQLAKFHRTVTNHKAFKEVPSLVEDHSYHKNQRRW